MAKGDRGSRGRQEYGRTERERGHERRDKEQRAQERREKESAKKEAAKKEEPGILDRTVGAVKDFFTGREDTAGFSPMGGPSSYGMSKKQFDTTIGARRHASRSLGERLAREVDYFQEAPMDYVSDLLDNPLVSGAAIMTGVGLPAFGVKVVDAAMDVYQNEEDPLGALGNVGASALSYTPIGATLPSPVRSIAKAGLKTGVKAAASTTAGVVGGKLAGGLGSPLAEAVTDNPYARAALMAGVTAGGAWGASTLAKEAMAQPRTEMARANVPRREQDSPRSSSPLVSSGEKAIASSKQLMQPADTGLYARTVKQLPLYGLTSTQQLPYYGV